MAPTPEQLSELNSLRSQAGMAPVDMSGTEVHDQPQPFVGPPAPTLRDRVTNTAATIDRQMAGELQSPNALPFVGAMGGAQAGAQGAPYGAAVGASLAARIPFLPPPIRAAAMVTGATIGAMAPAVVGAGVGRGAGEAAEILRSQGYIDLAEHGPRLANSTFAGMGEQVLGETLARGVNAAGNAAQGLGPWMVGQVTPAAQAAQQGLSDVASALKSSVRAKYDHLLDMPFTLAEKTTGGAPDIVQTIVQNAVGSATQFQQYLKGRALTMKSLAGDFMDTLYAKMTPGQAEDFAVALNESKADAQQTLVRAFHQPLDAEGTNLFVNLKHGRRLGRERIDEVVHEGGNAAPAAETGAATARSLTQARASLSNPAFKQHVERVVADRMAGPQGVTAFYARMARDPKLQETFTRAVVDEAKDWTTLRGALANLRGTRAAIQPTIMSPKSAGAAEFGTRAQGVVETAIRDSLAAAGRNDLIAFFDAGQSIARMRGETFKNGVVRDVMKLAVATNKKRPDALIPLLRSATPQQLDEILDAFTSAPSAVLGPITARMKRQGIPIPPHLQRIIDEARGAAPAMKRDTRRMMRQLGRAVEQNILNNSIAREAGQKQDALDGARLREWIENKWGEQKLGKIIGADRVARWKKIADVLELQDQHLEKGTGRVAWQLRQAGAFGAAAAPVGTFLLTGQVDTTAAVAGVAGLGYFFIPKGLSHMLQSPVWTDRFVRWAQAAQQPKAAVSPYFAADTVRFLRFTSQEMERLAREEEAEARRP